MFIIIGKGVTESNRRFAMEEGGADKKVLELCFNTHREGERVCCSREKERPAER